MTWQTCLDDHQQRFIEELPEFVRIPSVSAAEEQAADTQG